MDGKAEAKADPELENGGQKDFEEGCVCSLCGDIGFTDALLLCRKCGFRLQHTYCSRMYPAIDMESWSCEWCLHELEKENKRKSKVFEFLLEIARSLPEDSPSTTDENNTCRKDEKFVSDEKNTCRKDEKFMSDEKQFQIGSVETKEKPPLKKNIRCLEKNKALDRWRNLAKTKFGCRRYKLLADVHC